MDISQFRTTTDLANEGVWTPMHDDAEMRIASSGTDNVAYSAAIREIMLKPNLLGDGPSHDDMRDAAADYLVKDWKNLTLNNEVFPYNKENARTLLRDYPPIFTFVLNKSSEFQRYRSDLMDKMEGN